MSASGLDREYELLFSTLAESMRAQRQIIEMLREIRAEVEVLREHAAAPTDDPVGDDWLPVLTEAALDDAPPREASPRAGGTSPGGDVPLIASSVLALRRLFPHRD